MAKEFNWGNLFLGIIALVFVVALVGAFGGLKFMGINGLGGGAPANVQQTALTGGAIQTVSTQLCGTANTMTLTVTAQNKLNTTGTEDYDNTIYWFDETGNAVASQSDTTAGTVTLPCGKKYVGKLISASTSNAKVLGVSGDAKLVNGNIEVNGDISTKSITIYTAQHSGIKARMFDNYENAFMYDNSDASNSDFETTGTTFESTVDNATATDETKNNGVDVKLEIRATSLDTDFNDNGVYVLLDHFDTNIWEIPSASVDGADLSDVKGSLTVFEARAYSGYDYVYKFDKKVQDPSGVSVRVIASIISGATVSSDLTYAFASIGAYKSISSDDVKIGSVKDDASTTSVYTLQTYDLDLT